MKPEARTARLFEIVVPVPEDRVFLDSLNWARETGAFGGKPQGISVSGPTRAGKSTLRDKAVGRLLKEGYFPANPKILQGSRVSREFPKETPGYSPKHGGTTRYFTAFEAPSSGRARAFFDDFKVALNDPVNTRDTLGSAEARVTSILNANSVEVVFIDEFHHVVVNKKDKGLWEISEIVKRLQNETNTLFVFFGIDPIEDLHLQNAQFRGRNPRIIKLRPYDWVNEEDRLGMRRFIFEYCRQLPFDRVPTLDDEYMAFRIYQATSGSKGAIVELIRDAARVAIARDANDIELCDLDRVYRDIYATSRTAHVNPFATETPSEWVPIAAGFWQRSAVPSR